MMTIENIDWDALDIFSFLSLIGSTDESAFNFCTRAGIIETTKKCQCGMLMKIGQNNSQRFGLQFFCCGSNCKKRASVLSGSWFSRARISLRSSLLCVAAYASGLKFNQFGFYTGVKSTNTVVNWMAIFRDLCVRMVEEYHSSPIGGEGLTVEVDETMVFKRKNHTGRMLLDETDQRWAVGGICRESGDAFIVFVPNRNGPTLLSTLTQNIAPGTRVVTDGWRGYRNLTQAGFDHSTVNHSLNFVDPNDTSINTQKIERTWRTLKSIIPKGTNREQRSSYLCEFIFKQRNGWFSLTIGKRMELILNALSKISFN
jgi:hypothetical protein